MTSRVLKHLTHSTCPTCKAGIQSETFTGRVHCNGQHFESITFQCGAVIEWVPNFDSEQTRRPCPKDKSEIEKVQRRNTINAAIRAAVANLGLTEQEKRSLETHLTYWH